MDFVAPVLLGVVQGLTEFLPVSSSGHLALSRAILPEGALATPGVLFEIVVHLGTLGAAAICLRREVGGLARSLLPAARGDRGEVRAGRRLLGALLIASAPAGAVGLAFAGPLRTTFEGTLFAAAGLVATGAVLLAFRGSGTAARVPGAVPSLPASPRTVADMLWIGLAQAAAILPGISRSGLTIIAGRARGLTSRDAARFSFLLSGPAIAGAALLESVSALSAGGAIGETAVAELVLGFAAAFAAGMLALGWVFDWLARQRLHRFGWYCLSLGGIGLGLSSH